MCYSIKSGAPVVIHYYSIMLFECITIKHMQMSIVQDLGAPTQNLVPIHNDGRAA